MVSYLVLACKHLDLTMDMLDYCIADSKTDADVRMYNYSREMVRKAFINLSLKAEKEMNDSKRKGEMKNEES